MFCFNIVVHNIILNGTETEQKHFASVSTRNADLSQNIIGLFNVWGFLMENSVTFQYD